MIKNSFHNNLKTDILIPHKVNNIFHTGNEVVAIETKSLSIPCFDGILSEYLYDPYSNKPNHFKFYVYVLFEVNGKFEEVARLSRTVCCNIVIYYILFYKYNLLYTSYLLYNK